MPSIKVVHLANLDVTLPIHIGNYVLYQRAQGYDVSIICHPGQWLTRDTTIMDGIFVKIIKFEPRITPLTDLRSLFQLINYFRQGRFDIVHTHTVKPSLLGGLAARIAGVPIIVHTVHGLYLHESLTAREYRLFRSIAKLIGLIHDSFLSQNREDIETCVREGICPAEKITYLGNGIDLTRFDPIRIAIDKVEALRLEFGIQPGQPVIGIISRLVREKGLYEFLEAARILKMKGVDAKYLIIGLAPKGKPTAVTPEHLIREFGLEQQVLLLGFRQDIPELISLMDIVAFPSHGFEGIPRVLMESAALGRPVVATQVRGNVEAVRHGETGLLVPVRDARALAEAILQLVQDPEHRAELGKQARRHALKNFDERFFFWRTDLEYRRLLQSKLALDPALLLKPVPDAHTGAIAPAT